MNSVAEFMSRDHDRLDAIFKDFQNKKTSDLEKAKQLFLEFKLGLEQHILWEEEILFPTFEQRTGMREAGPTAVMRMEHGQIKNFLQSIQKEIAKSHRDEASLIQVLSSHNSKEESILYPWFDNTLSESERAATLSKIENSLAAER